MSKEIKSIEDALTLRLGRLVKENVELEQLLDQLTDEHNEVVRQLHGQEKRKNESSAKPTLGQIQKMSDRCDELEAENKQLRKYAMSIDCFIKDKEFYMPQKTPCPYIEGHPFVCSASCLECNSCLRVLDGSGVVCEQVLNGSNIGYLKPCPPRQTDSE